MVSVEAESLLGGGKGFSGARYAAYARTGAFERRVGALEDFMSCRRCCRNDLAVEYCYSWSIYRMLFDVLEMCV